jgi:hypothetical protein
LAYALSHYGRGFQIHFYFVTITTMLMGDPRMNLGLLSPLWYRQMPNMYVGCNVSSAHFAIGDESLLL